MALRFLSLCVSALASQAPLDFEAREEVSMYLSEERFPGMTILQPPGGRACATAWSMQAYPGGQDPRFAAAGAESPFELDAMGWRNLEDAVAALSGHLRLPALEPLQSPRALFDERGGRLRTLDELRDAKVAFFLEIGVWMWPPVRVGFERRIEMPKSGVMVLRTLSLKPIIFEVRDFLTPHDIEEVQRLGAEQALFRSDVMWFPESDTTSMVRTSSQAWLPSSISPVLGEIDDRISRLTKVPASHNEQAQLLRYKTGQFYHSHLDWIELGRYPGDEAMWLSKHFGYQDRLANVFWYLSDVEEGGETVFPKHGQPICEPRASWSVDHVDCPEAEDPDLESCEHGLKIRPRAGTVLLWYNFHADGRGDRNSMHGGCPVGPKDTKWSANKWVMIKPTNATATWIEDHPALARFGWHSEEEEDIEDDNDAEDEAEDLEASEDELVYEFTHEDKYQVEDLFEFRAEDEDEGNALFEVVDEDADEELVDEHEGLVLFELMDEDDDEEELLHHFGTYEDEEEDSTNVSGEDYHTSRDLLDSTYGAEGEEFEGEGEDDDRTVKPACRLSAAADRLCSSANNF